MSTDEPIKEPAKFKDRTTGLWIFGFLKIIGGILCLLMIPLLLMITTDPTFGGTTNVRAMIPAMGTYLFLGIGLIWLGVGSILAKRWARALTLVLAWMGLITGIASLGMISIWLCWIWK